MTVPTRLCLNTAFFQSHHVSLFHEGPHHAKELQDGSLIGTAYVCIPVGRNRRKWEAQITCLHPVNPQRGEILIPALLKMTADHEITRFLSVMNPFARTALNLCGVHLTGNEHAYIAYSKTAIHWRESTNPTTTATGMLPLFQGEGGFRLQAVRVGGAVGGLQQPD